MKGNELITSSNQWGHFSIGGCSFKVNQLCEDNFGSTTVYWTKNRLTQTNSGNVGTFITNSNAYNYVSFYHSFLANNGILIKGHKYLMIATTRITSGSCSAITLNNHNNPRTTLSNPTLNTWYVISNIFEQTRENDQNTSGLILTRQYSSVDDIVVNSDSMEVKNFMLFDLTDAFGSGNEPATIDSFYATPFGQYIKRIGYLPYTTGTIINSSSQYELGSRNVCPNGVEIGYFNSSTGQKDTTTSAFRCKDIANVEPNTTYKYFAINNSSYTVSNYMIFEYDSNKNFLSRYVYYSNGASHTTSANCRYINISSFVSNGPITSVDGINILLQLSSEKNTSYTPYKKKTILPQLPREYQELEYIESSGTQYIDTGWYNDYSKGFRIKIEYQPTVASQRYCLLSSYSGAINNPPFVSCEIKNNNQSRIYGYNGEIDKSIGSVSTTTKNYSIFEYSNGILYHECNGTSNRYTGLSYNGKSILSCLLFVDQEKRYSTFSNNLKMYSCVIYEENTLIRNFIPCYRKIDGVIGMYDTVYGVFYTNSGTGTFKKGREIHHTNEIIKLGSLLGKQDTITTLTPQSSSTWYYVSKLGISFTAQTSANYFNFSLIDGHKYFININADTQLSNISVGAKTGSSYPSRSGTCLNSGKNNYLIFTWYNTASVDLLYLVLNTANQITINNLVLCDLTQHGLDNLTAQQFYDTYHDYLPLLASGLPPIYVPIIDPKSAGSVRDEYKTNRGEIIRRVSKAKLKDLVWSYANGIFTTTISDIKRIVGVQNVGNISCPNYRTSSLTDVIENDKTIAQMSGTNGIAVHDSSYTDTTAFKNHFREDDYLYYELATYVTDKTLPIFNSVDLGTLSGWTKAGANSDLMLNANALASLVKKPATEGTNANIYCAKYITSNTNIVYTKGIDKSICISATGRIYIYDSSFTGTTENEIKAYLSGIYLIYEQTYSDNYPNYQDVDLGSLTVDNYNATTKVVSIYLPHKDVSYYQVPELFIPNYTAVSGATFDSNDKCIASSNANYIRIKNSDFTATTSAEIKAELSGIYLRYLSTLQAPVPSAMLSSKIVRCVDNNDVTPPFDSGYVEMGSMIGKQNVESDVQFVSGSYCYPLKTGDFEYRSYDANYVKTFGATTGKKVIVVKTEQDINLLSYRNYTKNTEATVSSTDIYKIGNYYIGVVNSTDDTTDTIFVRFTQNSYSGSKKVYYAFVVDLTSLGLDNLTSQQFYDKYSGQLSKLASGQILKLRK